MARTAEDVALMLQAIHGSSEWSPLMQVGETRDFVGAVIAGAPRRLRIAYCRDPARIGIDEEIERVCRDAAFGLEEIGAAVEEIDLDLSAARRAFLALRGLWFVTHMAPRHDKMAELGPNVSSNVRAGIRTTTTDLAAAEQERGRIWHRFRELFGRFDHVVTPCMAVSPFPVEQNYPDTIAGRKMETYVDWIAPTFVLSLTGLPVASVPCGFDAARMPVGLQVVGRPGGEEAVLALAAEIQRQRPIGLPNAPRA
jgi:amidase